MFVSRLERFLLAVFFSACLEYPMCAEEFPVEEYAPHVHGYLSSLENLAVDYTASDLFLDGSGTMRDEVSIVSIPGHFRSKMTRVVRNKDGTVKSSQIEWTLLRPDGFYVIREQEKGKFVLDHMDKTVTSLLLLHRSQIAALTILLDPIRVPPYLLLDRLRAGPKTDYGFKVVKDFRGMDTDGGATYKFRTSQIWNNRDFPGQFELNERWLLNRDTLGSRSAGIKIITECTYTTFGERLLPSRTTRTIIQGAGKPRTAVTEFSNYREYHGSLAEFSLTQFGLPEPNTSKYDAGTPWYLWFIGFAVVSLALGWYLRRRVRVRQAARELDSPARTSS